MVRYQCLRNPSQQYTTAEGINLTLAHVSLQMFGFDVGLGAFDALELSFGVFLRNRGSFGRTTEAVLHDGMMSCHT